MYLCVHVCTQVCIHTRIRIHAHIPSLSIEISAYPVLKVYCGGFGGKRRRNGILAGVFGDFKNKDPLQLTV